MSLLCSYAVSYTVKLTQPAQLQYMAASIGTYYINMFYININKTSKQ